MIKSRQKGRDYLPIKFFYNWMRSSVWEFAVLADGPIRSLQDLKGKKLGINYRGAGNIPQTKATLRSAALNLILMWDWYRLGMVLRHFVH